MKPETARRIARMKQVGFGVEIEMNHIDRKKAAQTALRVACRGRQEQRCSPGLDGYGRYTFCDWQDRVWTFQKDGSIQGPENEKCEMVTPVLHYDPDMAMLQDMVRALRKEGARSSASRGCGVHIHISGEGHTVRTILNLVNLMASHENQLIRAIGISPARQNRYCKTVDPAFLQRLREETPTDMDMLKRCWYNGHADESRYSPTRYHMLNLHSFFTRYHTIEFRLFQFERNLQKVLRHRH